MPNQPTRPRKRVAVNRHQRRVRFQNDHFGGRLPQAGLNQFALLTGWNRYQCVVVREVPGRGRPMSGAGTRPVTT